MTVSLPVLFPSCTHSPEQKGWPLLPVHRLLAAASGHAFDSMTTLEMLALRGGDWLSHTQNVMSNLVPSAADALTKQPARPWGSKHSTRLRAANGTERKPSRAGVHGTCATLSNAAFNFVCGVV